MTARHATLADCEAIATIYNQGIEDRVAMTALIDAARAAGFHKLVSRVFPENAASLRMIDALGFRQAGVYRRHGQLDGVWRDVTIVEKLL